ncbi:Arylsulfotransferase (ASST) [Desulfitobacterium dichloroeliminans LMG P-21439]|uniref:Arylsulfotransferase (ASST) n=1 Tax=Desulfitobacterium dichloroeliminans (strain LMG P-21439 / DCA1) TaxID=871963 RepID=L0F4R3_DESDL|nr:aryl-sulfate sulfotransferase [Desulfitobacterium dichloroeliminans]AGA67933.1 Arylsulfotransferase (ASST) [Desulfitobacterium dichloroeliminans LMG P-21439]
MDKKIKYDFVPHIITRQKEREQAYLAEFEAGHYTLNNPLVKVNPYEICPLTAMVMFKTPIATEVTILVKGKEQPGDICHTFPANTTHVLPIYGLYAGYDNTIEIILKNGKRNSITITTGPLHPEVVPATKIKTTPEYFRDNLMFITSATSRTMAVGIDYAGDVRWHTTVALSFDMKRMPNGHILVGTERLVKMPYFTSGLYEMAFSGKIFKEYRVPSGYHHDQFVMEDGNILVLTFDGHSHTVEDMCALIDPNTGNILKTWDYKTVLPQDVAGSGSQDAHDWFHNNAVWYDKKTHSLTFSGRHQDAVINIDFESGKLNWVIGDPEGWPQEMVEKYFFTPVGEGFEWQYEQHACVILPDGDVMLLDNGHFRSKNKEKYLPNKDNYTRGVRYRIDTEKMTIEQVWQYGKERGADFFSPYICNVEYYDEGHYLVHSGGIGYENGEPCEGMAVIKSMSPELKDHKFEFNSITCELIDDELVYEMQIVGNYYRAEKLPLYYANETAELGAGQILGSLLDTETTKMKIKAAETGELIPEDYLANIVEEEDRFYFNAIFETGEMAQLLLVSETGETLRYPINTVPQVFQAMCVGTFQKEDPRNVDTFINKTGLSGKYQVKLVARDKVFETGVTITA